MGDFNIDLLDRKNTSTKKLIDLTKPFGLRQLIKHPTRYSKDKNSILDLIYTNSDFIYDSGVCDVNLSDHQLILMIDTGGLAPICDILNRSWTKVARM